MYPSELGKATRRTPRMDRQIARILKLLESAPMTVPQLAEALFCSADCARHYIRLMYEATPKRVHISGWLPTERNQPTRIYSVGNHRDIKLITKKQQAASKRSDRDKAKILDLLALPQTVKQLKERVGLSRSWTRVLVTSLRNEGRVYIKAWFLPAHSGSQAPVYAAGNKPDAVRVRVRRAEKTKRAEASAKKRKKKVFSTIQQQPSPECAGTKYAHWSDEPVRIFRPVA